MLSLGLHPDWYQEGARWCSEFYGEIVYRAGQQRWVNIPRRITPQLCWMAA